MVIESDTIIRIAHKDIINHHTAAAHHINAIAPAFATERFQIPYRNVRRATSKNCIMVRINYRNAIYQHILRISYFNSPDGMIQYSPPDDTYILGLIYQQFRFDYCSRC